MCFNCLNSQWNASATLKINIKDLISKNFALIDVISKVRAFAKKKKESPLNI